MVKNKNCFGFLLQQFLEFANHCLFEQNVMTLAEPPSVNQKP